MTELTVLPFSNDKLWEIIQQQDTENACTVYELDIKKSYENLGKALIIYASNLNLSIKFSTETLTYEEKADIFTQYLDLIKIYKCDQLSHTLMHVLCRAKNIHLKSFSIFTDEEADLYINANKDRVKTLLSFMQSIPLYIAYQLSLVNKVKDDFAKYEHIENPKLIPLNIVNLFDIPQSCIFYNTATTDLVYYTYQFEQPCFGGKYLKEYVYTNKNDIVLMLADFFNKIENHVSSV
jgi:hypothetical protein